MSGNYKAADRKLCWRNEKQVRIEWTYRCSLLFRCTNYFLLLILFFLFLFASWVKQCLHQGIDVTLGRIFHRALARYRWLSLVKRKSDPRSLVYSGKRLPSTFFIMEPDVWKVEHLVFRLVYNTCNTREIYQLRYPMFDHRFAKLSSWTPLVTTQKDCNHGCPKSKGL